MVSNLNIHRTCAARVYLIGTPQPKTHPKPVGVRTERGRCCLGGDSDLVTMDRRQGIIYSQSGHGGDYERELEASFYHCWCPEILVYYETNRRLIYQCRCDERLKVKAEESTRLVYTGFRGGLTHLKIKTRLKDERLVSVMGECVIQKFQVRHQYVPPRHPPKDGGGLTISGNLKSFEGPILNCRVSRNPWFLFK